MWISKNMALQTQRSYTSELGEVSESGNGCFSGYGQNGRGRYYMASPGGMVYYPQKGERAVIVSTDSGDICTGIIHEKDDGLEAGELKLYSSGGASIVLKNDGSVLINGKEV